MEPLGIPLQSVPVHRSSSGVEAGTSGLLSSADMDLRVPMEFQQGSQASSHVETCRYAFLLSCSSSVRLPVELTWGFVAFSLGATGLSQFSLCFELIHRVTVETEQRIQVDLEWIGTLRSF